jgi:thymidylate synthase (FAD)
MEVKLIRHTPNAKRLLVFSKRTRHMVDAASWGVVEAMSEEQIDGELDYVFNTISSSWEFVDYTFLITGVTRAFTHQLVRHRVGVAFAQQAQRVAKMENFEYLTTGSCNKGYLKDIYATIMKSIQDGYAILLGSGARTQDARGVLPTNILTNILFKVNLRALSDMFLVRLCIRAQGEFQLVAREMQKRVLEVHPWTSPILGPNCLRYGVCKFPRFKDCPIKNKFSDILSGLSDKERQGIREEWEKVAGWDPQPTVTSHGAING